MQTAASQASSETKAISTVAMGDANSEGAQSNTSTNPNTPIHPLGIGSGAATVPLMVRRKSVDSAQGLSLDSSNGLGSTFNGTAATQQVGAATVAKTSSTHMLPQPHIVGDNVDNNSVSNFSFQNHSADFSTAYRSDSGVASTEITPVSGATRALPIEPLTLEQPVPVAGSSTSTSEPGSPIGRRRAQTVLDTSTSSNSAVKTSSRLTKRRLNNETKAINDYIVYTQQLLGLGSYSKVKLCAKPKDDGKNDFFAMKIMDKSKLKRLGIGHTSGWKKAQREIAILKRLRHENVIALEEVIDDPESCKLYLVLEWAGYGPLMRMMNDGRVIPDDDGNNKLPESEAKRILRCVISALKYVHHNGIAHRDIKPENILLTDDFDVKLSDFGVSAILDGSPIVACHEREGSVAFLSPEVLRIDGSDVDLFKVDVWALGCTAFTIMHGRLPWIAPSGTAADHLHEVEYGPSPPYNSGGATVSDEAISFIEACLKQNPDERATIDELSQHPWMFDQRFNTPDMRPTHSHDVSYDDLDTAITTGKLRDLTQTERNAVPAVPDLVFARRIPRYAATHFAMSPHLLLQHSFDDSCLVLMDNSPTTRQSPGLTCPSPYGRARSRGMENSPYGGATATRRSTSLPPPIEHLGPSLVDATESVVSNGSITPATLGTNNSGMWRRSSSSITPASEKSPSPIRIG